MSALLAAVRPEEWNFPLLVHVLGAMVLVGGTVTMLAAQALAWRRKGDLAVLARTAFRSLLVVAIPGWILMRVGGQWIASEEGYDGEAVPSWVDIGYVTADLGGILLLVATLLAGLWLRRLRRDPAVSSVLVGGSTALAAVLLLGYLVAVWAMTAKPA
jgi:hypothetical protein